MTSDIEIAQRIGPKHITDIAESIGIRKDELKLYGKYIAKVSPLILNRLKDRPDGKIILVTSVTPTKFGEGKTSTAIGLTQALGKLRKRVMLCLREPSLGPVFGIKGGACGGGYSQVVPMEDINLHFTGDGHMVSAANNLLCAMLDNHIYFNNRLSIDPNSIIIKRVCDINDRTLRNITFYVKKGFAYKSGFNITAASEVMAVLALSRDMDDLKMRLSRMIVAFNDKGRPIAVKELKATGAISLLLKDAIMPNLVQTLEHNPCFVHCGPFANIAHGANSLISLLMAQKLAEYVITESGFGAELGAEKFFDIVCREGNLKVDLAVIVVSSRAIKIHGLDNLAHHINIVKRFGVIPVVAINRFPQDSEKELEDIKSHCDGLGICSNISEAVAKGGAGTVELAKTCVRLLVNKNIRFLHLYKQDLPIDSKIRLIADRIYGAQGVDFTKKAADELKRIKEIRLNKLSVNIAKTQFSLSDNHKATGLPRNWRLKVKDLKICAGAGFIVAVCGDIMLMPGLPKRPAALRMDIDRNGRIKGLF